MCQKQENSKISMKNLLYSPQMFQISSTEIFKMNLIETYYLDKNKYTVKSAIKMIKDEIILTFILNFRCFANISHHAVNRLKTKY